MFEYTWHDLESFDFGSNYTIHRPPPALTYLAYVLAGGVCGKCQVRMLGHLKRDSRLKMFRVFQTYGSTAGEKSKLTSSPYAEVRNTARANHVRKNHQASSSRSEKDACLDPVEGWELGHRIGTAECLKIGVRSLEGIGIGLILDRFVQLSG